MKVCALMPMKDHSARLQNKNITSFGDKPLFYHMASVLRRSKYIDKIVINTDSERIIEMLHNDFPDIIVIKRPLHLIGDEISMNSLIEYDMGVVDGEHFLQTHATNPLLTAETIDMAIDRYFQELKNGYDSVNSVTKHQKRFFDDNFKPINHDPDGSMQTQLLNPIYEDNSNFYIFSRDSFNKTKKRVGERCFFFEVDKNESIDIDDASDFFMAEALYHARNKLKEHNNMNDSAVKEMQGTGLGGWITRPDEAIAEIMAKSGLFKWIAVDLEHTAISISEAGKLIRVLDLCGVEPYVRLSVNDPVQIKRVLDAGARGIIVPMVNTKEEALAAIKACFYPIKGNRGIGLGRAHDYGIGFEKYLKEVEPYIKVIVQIENIKAVNNIETIFSVNGIYAYMIGPYDLSGSLGKSGNLECNEMRNAIEIVKISAIRHNIMPGIHVIEPDPRKVRSIIQDGYKFIAVSFDTMMFARQLQKIMEEL